MTAIRIHPAAQAELGDAAEWYDTQRSGLGNELLSAVDDALDTIAAAPDRWPTWRLEPRSRRFVVPGFPFVVLYTVDANAITIGAVAHTSRDPISVVRRLKSAKPRRR